MPDMRYCGGGGMVQDKIGPVASGWNCYRIFLFQWSGVLARGLQYVWCNRMERMERMERNNPVIAGVPRCNGLDNPRGTH